MSEMFEIQIMERIEPCDNFPYQLVLKVVFKEKVLKQRLENKYLNNRFIMNFMPIYYIGTLPFSDNSFLDIHEAFTDEGTVVKFQKEKQAIKFYRKGIKYLNKYLSNEERELMRILINEENLPS